MNLDPQMRRSSVRGAQLESHSVPSDDNKPRLPYRLPCFSERRVSCCHDFIEVQPDAEYASAEDDVRADRLAALIVQHGLHSSPTHLP